MHGQPHIRLFRIISFGSHFLPFCFSFHIFFVLSFVSLPLIQRMFLFLFLLVFVSVFQYSFISFHFLWSVSFFSSACICFFHFFFTYFLSYHYSHFVYFVSILVTFHCPVLHHLNLPFVKFVSILISFLMLSLFLAHSFFSLFMNLP